MAVFRQAYDNLNFMMDDYRLPSELRRRIREYFRECRHMARVRSYVDLQSMMSPALRGEVAIHTYYDIIRCVRRGFAFRRAPRSALCPWQARCRNFSVGLQSQVL